MLKSKLSTHDKFKKRNRRKLRSAIKIYMSARNSLNAQAQRHGVKRR
jgi:hypothetical protein